MAFRWRSTCPETQCLSLRFSSGPRSLDRHCSILFDHEAIIATPVPAFSGWVALAESDYGIPLEIDLPRNVMPVLAFTVGTKIPGQALLDPVRPRGNNRHACPRVFWVGRSCRERLGHSVGDRPALKRDACPCVFRQDQDPCEIPGQALLHSFRP